MESDLERRIITLEQRVFQLGPAMTKEDLRSRRVLQWLDQVRASNDGAATLLIATMTDNSTSAPIVGGSVDLCDSSGNILLTLTTNSSGQATFTVTPGTSYIVGFYAVGYQSTNYVATITPVAGVNYIGGALSTGPFSFPPGTNRTLVDPTYGTFVIPYSSMAAGIINWDVTRTVNYTGACGGCSAVSGITVHYNLNWNVGVFPYNTLQIGYREVGGGSHCPTTGAVNITHTNNSSTVTIPEIHFPIVGGTGVNNSLYCSSGTIVVK